MLKSAGHAWLDVYFWLAEIVLWNKKKNKVRGLIDPAGGGKEEGKLLGGLL